MGVRKMLATVALAAALAGCGGGDDADYGSARAVATAFDCPNFKTQDPELFATDAGACQYRGHYTGIQWFQDDASRDSWADAPDAGTASLVGANWAVECQNKGDCAAIQKELGGTLD